MKKNFHLLENLTFFRSCFRFLKLPPEEIIERAFCIVSKSFTLTVFLPFVSHS
jgi:hypothetical protein